MDLVERRRAWLKLRHSLIVRLNEQQFLRLMWRIKVPLTEWLEDRYLPVEIAMDVRAPRKLLSRLHTLAVRLDQVRDGFEPEVIHAIDGFLREILKEPRSNVIAWIRGERGAGRLLTVAELDLPETRNRCENALDTEVPRAELRAARDYLMGRWESPRWVRVPQQEKRAIKTTI